MIYSRIFSLFTRIFKILFSLSNLSNQKTCFLRFFAIDFDICRLVLYNNDEFHISFIQIATRFEHCHDDIVQIFQTNNDYRRKNYVIC